MVEWAGILGLMTWGAPHPDLVAFLLRLGVGVPFFISGMNKLFCPICHGWLVSNLTRSHIPFPRITCWWLAFWEAAAGLLLALGLFTGFAAVTLLIVCVVAWLVSWRRKLEAKRPAHIFDAATEVLFCFDVLLVWLILGIGMIGPGAWSLDAYLFSYLR